MTGEWVGHTAEPIALVIGYGNELRRDDGIGPYVARTLAARQLPGVHVLTVHQLTPELAEPLSQVQLAIFVDAGRSGHGSPVQVQRIVPTAATLGWTHSCDPYTLLALARHLFGAAPPAWAVVIEGADFTAGEGLSPLCRSRADTAREQIEDLLSPRRFDASAGPQRTDFRSFGQNDGAALES